MTFEELIDKLLELMSKEDNETVERAKKAQVEITCDYSRDEITSVNMITNIIFNSKRNKLTIYTKRKNWK